MKITEITRRESLDKLDNATVNKHIIKTLENGSELTAREIAKVLYDNGYIPYPVRQAVAPRLTELEMDGIVKVVRKAYDPVTKRSVAVYRMVSE